MGGKFGGKGGKGFLFFGGGVIGFGVIVVIVVVVWFFIGFYIIGEVECGVVLCFGKYDCIVDLGLNWCLCFIDEVILVNV